LTIFPRRRRTTETMRAREPPQLSETEPHLPGVPGSVTRRQPLHRTLSVSCCSPYSSS
jgi:hypothetical protein